MNEAEQRTLLGMLYPLLLKQDWKRKLEGDRPACFVLMMGVSTELEFAPSGVLASPFIPPPGQNLEARFLSGVLMPDPALATTGHAWYLSEPHYDRAFADLHPEARRAWGELMDQPKPRRLFYRERQGDTSARLFRNPDVPQP